jgi:hypothetical protein
VIASEAVTRIQRKLGYREDKADEILEELQDAQHSLENGVPSPLGRGVYTPWFMVTEVASALTTIDEERLLLPEDFTTELEGFKLYRYDADATEDDEVWIPLEKAEEQYLKAKYPGDGDPQGYYIAGGYFRIVPTPDEEFTIKLIYAGRDTVLTSGITNKWLTHAPQLLISAAGMSMAQSLRDAGALTFYQNRFALENNSLYNQTLARELTNDRPVMGGRN